jgi:hypothetical protein
VIWRWEPGTQNKVSERRLLLTGVRTQRAKCLYHFWAVSWTRLAVSTPLRQEYMDLTSSKPTNCLAMGDEIDGWAYRLGYCGMWNEYAGLTLELYSESQQLWRRNNSNGQNWTVAQCAWRPSWALRHYSDNRVGGTGTDPQQSTALSSRSSWLLASGSIASTVKDLDPGGSPLQWGQKSQN